MKQVRYFIIQTLTILYEKYKNKTELNDMLPPQYLFSLSVFKIKEIQIQ